MSVSTAYRSSFTTAGTLPTSSGGGPVPPIYKSASGVDGGAVVSGGLLQLTAANTQWTVTEAPRTESLADGERHYIKVSARGANDIYFGLLDTNSLGPVIHVYGGPGSGLMQCGVWNGSGFVGQGFTTDFNESTDFFISIRRASNNYYCEYSEDDGTGNPASWQAVNGFQVTPDGSFNPAALGFLLIAAPVGGAAVTSTFDALNMSSTEASSALRETAATGDYHAGATWVGGVAPQPGDRVKLNDGHTVTVRLASSPIITVGSNVAGNLAIEGVGTGKLVLEDGVRLNLQGHVQQGNATWEVGAGCLIEATNVGWEWRMGTASFQTSCILKINGLRSNKSTLRTVSGGTKLRFDVLGGFLGSAQFQFTGVSIENVGLMNSSSWDVGFPYLTYFRDCIFDGESTGYTVAVGLYGGSSKVELTRTTFKSGAGNPTFSVSNQHAGAEVILDTVVFDGSAPTLNSVDVRFRNVLFKDAFNHTASTRALEWKNVAIHKTIRDGTPLFFDVAARLEDTAIIATNNTSNNFHFVVPNAGASVRTWQFYRWIFDTGRYTSGDADGFTNPIGGAGSVLDVEECIVLPSNTTPGGGTSNTTIVTMAGTSDNVKLRGRRNTYFVNGPIPNGHGQGSMQFAEASNGSVGQIDEWRSNLAWSDVANGAYHMWAYYGGAGPSTAVAGIVNAAQCTHNAHWNPVTSGPDTNTVYQLSGPSAGNMPSGVNDVLLSANPFTDRTRDAAKWAFTLGLSETSAAAIDALKKVNDFTGQVPGATIAAYIAYVREGFKPTGSAATALRVAAHDGGYIGAVEPDAGVGEAPSISLSLTSASRTVVEGATSFTPVVVNVTNGGTGSLTGLSVGETGDAGGIAKGVLAGATGPTTLTIDQDTGLAGAAPGTYTINYPVDSSAPGLVGGTKTVVLTVIVQAAPTGGSGPKNYSGRVKNNVNTVIPGIPFSVVSNSNPSVVSVTLAANNVDFTFTPLAVGTSQVVVQAGGLQRSYTVTVTAA